jgi:uncharacterized protein YceH (UPF0502 family)
MGLKFTLSALEARIIGCLIEKQITTPDQYPLSINALTNACNQKSNRDPVLNLAEAEVQQLVDGLVRKHVMIERSGFGSRVAKYQHCFCNTEFSGLKFSLQELAIVCELLVRGPQTPGELRTRAARMTPFADASEVQHALESLANRPKGALVVQLPREPGRRDSRYLQLFTGPPAAELLAPAAVPATAAPASASHSYGTAAEQAPAAAGSDLDARLTQLELAVSELRTQIEQLREEAAARS